ncbi:DUF3027 domain-containing protein, partial [Nocardia concava]|uniref:DUF3027 domain-containing protein n=1 Tax=Nocardia concava TaxID=257281 RepID=UPI0012F70B4D
ALEIGLGRTQVLSREGREDAADRWFTEYGPDTDMARAAPSTCGLCGFYVPLAGALRSAFGVCANAMGADGHVVHVAYGCGAHSDVVLPSGNGSPLYEAYDDAAVEMIPVAELRPEPVAAEADDAAEAEAVVADPESPVAEVEAPAAEVESVDASGESVETAPAAAPETAVEEGVAALFDVPDPDAVYDDAWAVNAVRVESDAVRAEPDSGAAESR